MQNGSKVEIANKILADSMLKRKVCAMHVFEKTVKYLEATAVIISKVECTSERRERVDVSKARPAMRFVHRMPLMSKFSS